MPSLARSLQRMPDVLRGCDPRYFQLLILGMLLIFGLTHLDFEVLSENLAAIAIVSLVTQWIGTRWSSFERFDPRSAAITICSLGLLLRTNAIWVAALAAALAIGSKFTIRAGGKHIYNPANFGIAATWLLTGQAWVSPGQWGSAALLAAAIACMGVLVLMQSRRSDITWAFLGFYLALVFGRALWLGDPIEIPLRRLTSGTLIVFAFFMISDPKTIPNARLGRILYAGIIALGGFAWDFLLYNNNGLIWALAALAPLVPLIDRAIPATRYEWGGAGPGSESKGATDAPVHLGPAPGPWPRPAVQG